MPRSSSAVLAIPAKRFDRRTVTYLTAEVAAALLAAPDRHRWEGRRDRALLALGRSLAYASPSSPGSLAPT